MLSPSTASCAASELARNTTDSAAVAARSTSMTELDAMLRRSSDGGLVASLIAFVVRPRHRDLVAHSRTFHSEAEERISRNRLTPLRVEHCLPVMCDEDLLDEMDRNDVALCVLPLAGLHRMTHQDANVCHVTLQRSPDSHRFSHSGSFRPIIR